MGYDIIHASRVYRMPHDEIDRTMAAGSPFLLGDDVTCVAAGVAIAMAVREVNGGVGTAVLHERTSRTGGDGRPR